MKYGEFIKILREFQKNKSIERKILKNKKLEQVIWIIITGTICYFWLKIYLLFKMIWKSSLSQVSLLKKEDKNESNGLLLDLRQKMSYVQRCESCDYHHN